jgi:hypothetical protein
MQLFNFQTILLTLLSLLVFTPNKVKAEEFQPLTNEQLKANPHLCVPIIGQSQNNGIVVNQVVGNNCQAYINAISTMQIEREREKTRQRQFETNAKMNLFQLFMSLPRK